MSSNSLSLQDSDTFKILIATDIHLGFEEKDLIRGKKKIYFYHNNFYSIKVHSYGKADNEL